MYYQSSIHSTAALNNNVCPFSELASANVDITFIKSEKPLPSTVGERI